MKFIKRHIWILLLIFSFISYGQILKMNSWQDDNAIFFKLEHINEPAGFFGRGLIGEGPYRFSFTPYWFIYKIFGNNNFFPYYALIFIFYFLSAIAVYKLFSNLISKKAGIVAGILFSCGFIASDGFMWLANAMVADVSIILLCTCLFFYYNFYLKKSKYSYLIAIILFWATAFLAPIRSYYFIGIIIIFELMFMTFRKKWKSFIPSILRLIPFLYVFYYFFIYGGDARTGLVKGLLESILSGKLYIFYGLLSSVANIIIPDNLTSKLFIWQLEVTKATSIGFPYVIITTLFLSIFGFYILFRKNKKSKLLIIIFSIIELVWLMTENSIFNIPVINLNETSSFTVLLGGIILLFLAAIYLTIDSKFKNKYLFLLISFLIAISAYWAYEPLVVLNTTHRYLVGAFSILVGLLGIIYINANKKIKILIVIWGLVNLINSFTYQKTIFEERTYPVDNFYSQLKNDLPNIKKGDILYFDFTDNTASNRFNNATSTASMPNETSIAWRYGIDRYDFSLVTNFDTFVGLIKTKSIPIENIHTFYYSGSSLVDTTDTSRKFLENGSPWTKINYTIKNTNIDGVTIDLTNPIASVTPIQFNIELSATPQNPNNLVFPYSKDPILASNTVATNDDMRTLAFKYNIAKKNITKNEKVTTSSSWQKDLPSNLIDSDPQTNWRSDRLLWGNEKTNLSLDLGSQISISKFIWINGYANSTPTKYSIEVSSDKNTWTKISSISSTRRIETKEPQIVSFTPTKIRYIKMNIDETLDQDATQIAEVWAVPSEFDNLNIKDAERFLTNPMGYIPDIESFNNTITNLNNKGEIQLANGSKEYLSYDNLTHPLSLSMMAHGTEISELKLSNLKIPGNLVIKKIEYKYLNLKEIQNK